MDHMWGVVEVVGDMYQVVIEMDQSITVGYRWLLPVAPCTFDEAPYFGSHVPLFSPRRAHSTFC
jgi:hypothetical protein